MPKLNESASATAAVDEAIRTLSNASQRQTAEAERILASSSSFWNDLLATNRQLYTAWAVGVESMLKTSFDAQSSVVATWPEVLELYQKATLDAVRGTITSTEKFLTPSS